MASYKNIFFKILALSIAASLLLTFTSCRQAVVTNKKNEKAVTPEVETIASLPVTTIEDVYSKGCIDCHKKVSDEKDYRLNVMLAKEGKHPDITEIVKTIPDDCMNCHKEGTEHSIGNIAHHEHYKNPETNTFISEYQGSCFSCHSMDIEKGKVGVKSLTEEEQPTSLNGHVDISKLDCATCHKKLNVSVDKSSWGHTNVSKMDCATCHQKLNVSVDKNSWDHSSLDQMDCTTCHQKLNVSVDKNSWDHSKIDCNSCHGSEGHGD